MYPGNYTRTDLEDLPVTDSALDTRENEPNVHSEGINSDPPVQTISTASKLEQGYEDERFESSVSKSYHCVICLNVFKDPVMCRENEHLFCRACITKHLTNSRTCPSCMDKLTVDTLREAPRIVTNYLSELRIRCEFFSRGCGFIDLEKLDKHVKECGYAPVVCSNEGCESEVNKRDLIHHETIVCEHRRVQCHNCGETREELNKVNEKLDKMETKFTQLNETLNQIKAHLFAQNTQPERQTLSGAAEKFSIRFNREPQSQEPIALFEEPMGNLAQKAQKTKKKNKNERVHIW